MGEVMMKVLPMMQVPPMSKIKEDMKKGVTKKVDTMKDPTEVKFMPLLCMIMLVKLRVIWPSLQVIKSLSWINQTQVAGGVEDWVMLKDISLPISFKLIKLLLSIVYAKLNPMSDN